MAYAQKTAVPVDRSKAEIERIVTRAGATDYLAGTMNGMALVGFRMRERVVRFEVPMPNGAWMASTRMSPSAREASRQQEERRRWRALVLTIKAKLEAIESRIETFDEAFMAHVVMPGGRTVKSILLPQIERAYAEDDASVALIAYEGPRA